MARWPVSPCPTCGALTMMVKLRSSGRFARVDLPLRPWVDSTRRNPGQRVVTEQGAVVTARPQTSELFWRASRLGWAVHWCDPLFRLGDGTS